MQLSVEADERHVQQYAQSDYGQLQNESRLFIGRSVPEHDEELVILKNEAKVIWKSGQRQLNQPGTWGSRTIQSLQFPLPRSATMDPSHSSLHGAEALIRGSNSAGGPIIAALWATFANFRDTVPEPQLCVLQRDCLFVINSEGEQFSVQLPCPAKRMWVLLEGIIIEREDEPEVNTDPLSEYEELAPPPVLTPTLFSLLHPLEELKPVSQIDMDSIDEDDELGAEQSYLCDPNEQMVFTCPSQPFVLTYHSVKKVHSLWLIRQSKREIRNRMRVDPSNNILGKELDDATSGVARSSSSAALSRRSSMGWHTPHAPPLTPPHPIHNKPDAGTASNPQEFYQKFLLSTLQENAAHPAVAYHPPSSAHAEVLDNEDSQIHSELLFERSWIQEEEASYPCSHVFLSSTDAGEPLLCMFTQQTQLFQAFELSSSLHPSVAEGDEDAPLSPRVHLSLLFSAHFLSVAPIYSAWRIPFQQNINPYNYSILALELDGSLSLYQGSSKVTTIEARFGSTKLTPSFQAVEGINVERGGSTTAHRFGSHVTPARGVLDHSFTSTVSFTPLDPQSLDAQLFTRSHFEGSPAQQPKAQVTVPFSGSIIELTDAVSNRVSLRLANGALFRVSIPTYYISPLVQTCMNCLSCTLSPAFMSSLRSDLLTLRTFLWQQSQSKTSSSQSESAVQLTPSPLPSEQHEWQAFVLLFRHLLQYRSNAASSANVSSVITREFKGDDAWKQLLSSKHHRARVNSPLLRTFSASVKVEKAKDKSDQSIDLSALSFHTTTSAFLALIPKIFICLHLVYEDLKIPILQASRTSTTSAPATPSVLLASEVLKPLSIVMSQIAYLDVYARDLSSNQGSWQIDELDLSLWSKWRGALNDEQLSLIPAQPPSIHAFLYSKLKNTSTTTAAVYPLPIVVQQQQSSNTSANNANHSGLHHFLLNHSMEEPFAWSRKLLLFYDLLTKPSSESLVSAETHDKSDQFAVTSTALLPTPKVQVSELIHSPYALPAIEQRQIEAQRLALSNRARTGSNVTSTATTPAHTPAPISKKALFSPQDTPLSAIQPAGSVAPPSHLLVSPLLTSPFPTALSPYGVKHSSGSNRRVQQHKRVHAMQLLAASAAAKAASHSTLASPMQSDGDELVSPNQLSIPRPAEKKRARVSFGANTTVMSSVTLPVRTHSIAAEFPIFSPSSLHHSVPLFLSHSAAESVVLAMVAEDFTLEHLSMLPFGIALPLYECLKQVRENPPVNLQHLQFLSNRAVSMWPREAYTLIGREDLGRMFSTNTDTGASVLDKEHALEEEMEIAAGRPADVELERKTHESGSAAQRLTEQPDLDGTLFVQREASLRFGVDLRLKEVRHLVRSDRVLCVSLDASVRTEIDAGNAEASIENQVRLGIVAKRALSLTVARGMYTMASIVPVLTEALPIPPLVLKGRLPPLNSLVECDLSPASASGITSQMLQWPEFHNSVAAALRVQPTSLRAALNGASSRPPTDADSAINRDACEEKTQLPGVSGNESSSVLHQITRTWIAFNRPRLNPAQSSAPAGLSYAFAGFLFGLGLTGHLNCLSPSDLYWYLQHRHEPTVVAVLLGMAACRRGTSDPEMFKTLKLHIPSLLPANFSELSIPSAVQSCALLGVGILLQSSCDRLMAEVLLNEIGRRPDRAKVDESFLMERENYSLSAGFGLGLLLLGKGADPNAMSTLADLNVEKKLSLYMHGGKDISKSHSVGGISGLTNGPASQFAEIDEVAGVGAAGVGWMSDSSQRVSASNRSYPAAIGAGARSANANNTIAKNGRIKEGQLVNIDVTSPAATLALGLMYLQSNNQLIADRFIIPDTHFMLDYVRSDFIYLRVLAKHLVLWDSIPCSSESIATMFIPELLNNYCLNIRHYMSNKNKKGKRASFGYEEKEEKYGLDGSGEVDEELLSESEERAFTTPLGLPASSMDGMESEEDVDYSTLRQSYMYIIAANCFALGMKFAGTADPKVLRILLRFMAAYRLISKKRGGGDFVSLTLKGLNPAAQLHKVDRGTIDACVVAIAQALALVMAGSGNLRMLQLFRSLLKTRPEKNTPAGWYTSISMCIGFLFLGGGKYTIDTHKSSPHSQANIAFLIISLYPHLSQNVDDQRYYLQIYRHLYVLATTPRGLQTIDVDTGLSCYVPLEVIVQQGQKKEQATPQAPVLKRLKFITPCLLPNHETIHQISIVSPRFHPLTLQLKPTNANSDSNDSASSLVPLAASHLMRIYVKKKIGFESYEKDPKGLRSIMSRTFPHNRLLVESALGRDTDSVSSSSSAASQRAEFLKSFSTDPRLLSFTHLFIREQVPGFAAPSSIELFDYLSAILYECLQEEKFFQMIQIYMQLFHIAHDEHQSSTDSGSNSLHWRHVEAKLSRVEFMWNLVLIKQYYRSVKQQQTDTTVASVSNGNASKGAAAKSPSLPRNHSTSFASLPLAEGSAGVELADAQTFSVTSFPKPLLSLAFLDAIFHRVDNFLVQHGSLQAAFASYIKRIAKSNTGTWNAADAAAVGEHPLLGSLLTYWSVPDPLALHSGLVVLQQSSTPSTPPMLRSNFQLVMAGLIWQQLPTVAIQAILKAIQSA